MDNNNQIETINPPVTELKKEPYKYTIQLVRLPTTELKIKEPPKSTTPLPTSVDLRLKFPPCYDQGRLGSCTAQAIIGIYQYLVPSFMGSSLFLYYNERVIGRTVNYDSGAYIRDGILSMKIHGVCGEKKWPYIISNFKIKPPPECYANALKYKALTAYSVIQTVTAMKDLLNTGFPFVVGIAVYNSFQNSSVAKNGLVPMPPVNKFDKLLGGHAVAIIGFDDEIQCPGAPPGSWLCRNSWGTSWGLDGNFWIPYSYLTNKNLSTDNWVIKTYTS
jgi:C1A family cysteine protease